MTYAYLLSLVFSSSPVYETVNWRAIQRNVEADGEFYLLYPEFAAERRACLDWLSREGIDHHYVWLPLTRTSPLGVNYGAAILMVVNTTAGAVHLRTAHDRAALPADWRATVERGAEDEINPQCWI